MFFKDPPSFLLELLNLLQRQLCLQGGSETAPLDPIIVDVGAILASNWHPFGTALASFFVIFYLHVGVFAVSFICSVLSAIRDVAVVQIEKRVALGSPEPLVPSPAPPITAY